MSVRNTVTGYASRLSRFRCPLANSGLGVQAKLAPNPKMRVCAGGPELPKAELHNC